MNSNIIEKSIESNASPELAFCAISDEHELEKWLVDVPKLEKLVGGKVLFQFLKENSQLLEKDYVIEGTILEFIPNEKLSYTWKPIDDPNYPETIVTWKIESKNNITKVTVLHSGLKTAKDFSRLNEGWTYFLNRLVIHLGSKT